MSLHDYKGHQITLIPSPEGSMWSCQYVIRATGQTEVDGFPAKTASTLENVLTPIGGEIKDQRYFFRL